MPLRLKYVTLRDPSLTHQAVFAITSHGAATTVSCNCRNGHPPMGRTFDLDDARALYNNPRNHMERFIEEDRAKW